MRLRTVALLPLLVLLVIPALASPPPVNACHPCGDGFLTAAERHGLGTDVERSTATVVVHWNGTADWTVRNRLSNGSATDRLAGSPRLLGAVAADAFQYHYVTLRGTRVADDGTLVLRYRMGDAATTTPGGVLRFDHFREEGGQYVSGLGADRLTVRGPDGTVVTRAPPGADVDGNEFTLTEYRTYGGDGPFVTFAPSGGAAGEFLSFVSVSLVVGEYVVRNLLLFVLLPAGVLSALLVGVVRYGGGGSPASGARVRTLSAVVGGLGALCALHLFVPLLPTAPSTGDYEPAVLVAGVAHLALAAVARSDVRLTLRRIHLTVVGSWVLGCLVALGTSTLVPSAYSVTRSGPPIAVFLVLPLLFMTVVGYAAGSRENRPLALVAPPLALAVVVALAYPITASGGMFYFLFPLLLVGYAVAVSVLGLPAFLLGRAFAATNVGRPPGTD